MQKENWHFDWDEALDNMQGRNPHALVQSWQDTSDEFKTRWALISDVTTDLNYGKHPREKYDISNHKVIVLAGLFTVGIG